MANNSLAGGNITVCVYEAAGGGVVVAGLQVIQSGFLVWDIANRSKMARFLTLPEGLFPSGFCVCFWLERQPRSKKLPPSCRGDSRIVRLRTANGRPYDTAKVGASTARPPAAEPT